MSETPEEDDFDEVEDAADGDSVNVDQVLRSLDAQKRKKTKPGEQPAWRKLEDHFDRQRTQRLVEDFEDFDLDE